MDDEIILRLLDWAKGKKRGPFGIELSPTLRCNLNCLFCWRYGQDDLDFGKEIPLERYFSLLEEAKKLDVKEVKIIGGGESTFRRDTIQIMKKVKELGFFGYICTNGTMFRDEDLKMLVDKRWDHLKISLHGSDAKTHDHMTGVKGSFDRVIHALSIFSSLKKDQDTLPFIEFGIVLGKPNFKQVPDIIHLAAKYGVRSVFVEPITVYSEMGKALKMDADEEKEFSLIAGCALDIADQEKISTNLSQFITKDEGLISKTNRMESILKKHTGSNESKTHPLLDGISCYEPFYRVGVRTDGIVCPCGFFDEESKANIMDATLEEIWFGPYFEERRRQMLDNDLSPYCSRCCTTLVSNNLHIKEELKRHAKRL